MTKTQELKQPIRQWLALFPEQRLVDLLAHAQDGKLSFYSCCCLIGMLNAKGRLRGRDREPEVLDGHEMNHHLTMRSGYPEAERAEDAYLSIGIIATRQSDEESESRRRRILIPMIRSEMWQREHRKSLTQHHPVLSLTISPMEVVAEQERLNVPTAL